METWRWITSTRRKPRESATESKPPRTWFGVRVKGWGKSPPGLRRRGPHGKPRQEQDRIGGVYGPSSAYAPGVSHQACSNARRRGMTAEPERGNRTRLTGRLDIYRQRPKRSGEVPGPPARPGGFSQFVPRPPARPGGLSSRSCQHFAAWFHQPKLACQ